MKRNSEHIVTYLASLPDGTHVLQHPDGRLERRPSDTDWTSVDALTDQEIEDASRNDPDAVPPDFDWESAAVVPPRKRAISIRLDTDILDFFKREGSGYQRRMNAVLRAYMTGRDTRKSTKKRA